MQGCGLTTRIKATFDLIDLKCRDMLYPLLTLNSGSTPLLSLLQTLLKSYYNNTGSN